MSVDDTRFDNIFMSVIQNKKTIQGFFESVYGFLRRNTDFFQDQKQAEKVITEECSKQFAVFVKDQKEKEAKKQAEEAKKLAKEQQLAAEKARKEAEQQKKPVEQPKPAVVTPPPVVETPAVVPAAESNSTEKGAVVEEDDDKGPTPLGNGGKTEQYIWTQTLNEMHIYMPVSSTLRGKSVNVKFNLKHLKVAIDNQTVIDKDFPENINVEESLWTLEEGQIQDYNGKFLHLSVEKWKNQMSWWECALIGDEKINTKKIQPESSKLSDLDDETGSTVRKMMFDMRQKQAGLPSSDELKKQDMLQGFMKQHPEMDFSKCKFN